MKRSRKVLLLCLALLLIIVGAIWNNFTGNPISSYFVDASVKDYLFLQKEYGVNEIKTINTHFSKATGRYVAEVTFQDEPDVIYHYEKRGNTVKQVYAFDITDKPLRQFIHEEKE
ncbi:DUF3139 domain-containing protein [Brevibacillus sp. AY1]|uniref:DUF3139 domain-containing protein n=1 Tax=Brevibacillus sp. AY1 TaxID=2807621 RepID=UPI0024539F97|nr:DUF3139 domain-containing protein [Brevibacillus sp. AY1]MDH4618887.1 DUF3139 domain-containing protein [Brevibacillus sp. AY1]